MLLCCIFTVPVSYCVTDRAVAGDASTFFSETVFETGPATPDTGAQIAARTHSSTSLDTRGTVKIGSAIMLEVVNVFIVEEAISFNGVQYLNPSSFSCVYIRLALQLALTV